MVIIKTPAQIDGIRLSCRLAAQTLAHTAAHLRSGISTQDLNDIAHRFILDHGAIPAPLNYGGYPKSICASINNVVCHGIPSSQIILRDGDIINLDITTVLDGYFGDTSASYAIGSITPLAQNLLDATRRALTLSIQSIKPGRTLNQSVGQIIEPYVKKFGFSVVRELGGHGIGLKFHEDPFVFHFDTSQNNTILKPGMIFTIEPMINASPDYRVTIDKQDGWTVRTADGSLSAQFEHTVLVTPTGCEILTQL